MFLAPALLAALAALYREERQDGGSTKSHLNRLEAGQVLGGHGDYSISVVDAHIALCQVIFSHGPLSLAGPLQAVIAVSFTWTVVTIIFFLLRHLLHLTKLLVDDGIILRWCRNNHSKTSWINSEHLAQEV